VRAFIKMVQDQDYACAICGRSFYRTSEIMTDHNHLTGVVNAALCLCCNLSRSTLRRLPDYFERVAAYNLKYGAD
jgi:hypothetical protein